MELKRKHINETGSEGGSVAKRLKSLSVPQQPGDIDAATTRQRNNSPSRLETLPREIREQIYFHLGFPVSGRCIHQCNTDCLAYAAHKKRFGRPSNEYKPAPRLLTIEYTCPHARLTGPVKIRGFQNADGRKV